MKYEIQQKGRGGGAKGIHTFPFRNLPLSHKQLVQVAAFVAAAAIAAAAVVGDVDGAVVGGCESRARRRLPLSLRKGLSGAIRSHRRRRSSRVRCA